MAARVHIKSLAFFFISILFFSCFFRPDEARPLTAAKHKRFQNAIGKTFVTVKTAGPSPRGKGHRLTPTDQSVGEIMHSGPSPGANH
nr:precursor of CEP16-like [Ipomoea batatas]